MCCVLILRIVLLLLPSLVLVLVLVLSVLLVLLLFGVCFLVPRYLLWQKAYSAVQVKRFAFALRLVFLEQMERQVSAAVGPRGIPTADGFQLQRWEEEVISVGVRQVALATLKAHKSGLLSADGVSSIQTFLQSLFGLIERGTRRPVASGELGGLTAAAPTIAAYTSGSPGTAVRMERTTPASAFPGFDHVIGQLLFRLPPPPLSYRFVVVLP